ncbi:MAG: hypothetical protein J6Y29_05105 [Clostridiales bacterium]|nr:hypothetical protein [Clostridiales bacterium]
MGEKKDFSKLLGDAFTEFVNQKSTYLSRKAKNTSIDHLNLGLIQETYSGALETHLKEILKDRPLTFENLHIALQENKSACKQIKRIISKIYSNQEKIDAIYKIFKNCESNQKELDDYCASKFIHPRFTLDKSYKNMKSSIDASKKFLAEKYNISNKADMQKKLDHSKKRLALISRLYAKLNKLKVKDRTYLVLSVKKLVKKVKGNIISLHPELQQFIDFLSFEQISNIKILKEQFGFSPKSIDDFAKEIKACKIRIKNDSEDKEYYSLMLNLLDAVSSDYYKNYIHSKNLEKGYTKEQTTDRTIPYGEMDM